VKIVSKQMVIKMLNGTDSEIVGEAARPRRGGMYVKRSSSYDRSGGMGGKERKFDELEATLIQKKMVPYGSASIGS
jgi:hypothetical protein